MNLNKQYSERRLYSMSGLCKEGSYCVVNKTHAVPPYYPKINNFNAVEYGIHGTALCHYLQMC